MFNRHEQRPMKWTGRGVPHDIVKYRMAHTGPAQGEPIRDRWSSAQTADRRSDIAQVNPPRMMTTTEMPTSSMAD